ncbi:hypothetical protein EV715DRAFT_290386 [Schizophyllum commune]
MESLNTLASSLPSANQGADQALMNDFKAAALSITNFYRSSRAASARAYDSGYAAACHDILRMIERGVSADGGPTAMASNRASASENPMNVGRVMDWIEARLEALKAREEEEAEDEARKDAKDEGRRPIAQANAPSTPSSPQAPARTLAVKPAPPQPQQDTRFKPDPQSSMSENRQPLVEHQPQQPPAPASFPFISFPAPEPLAPQPLPSPSIGAKRRHAVMMMLDNQPGEDVAGRGVSPTAATVSRGMASAVRGVRQSGGAAGPGRRRPRRDRDARDRDVMMEVSDPEDGGRERKRVARR